jgi:hypothetical protein
MGYASIVARLGDVIEGRYTINYDLGADTLAAIVGTLNTAINKTLADIDAQTVELNKANELIAKIAVVVGIAQDTYITIVSAVPFNQGAAEDALKDLTEKMAVLAKSRGKAQPLSSNLTKLKFQLSSLRKRAAGYVNSVVSLTKDCYSADLNVLQPGQVVQMCEVNGEFDQVVIAPAGGAIVPSVIGYPVARDICSPEQSYFNVAILPGWQKFKPTYRVGEITSINWDTNTCSVSLLNLTSSAQRLSVNQEDTLNDLAIVYMTCGARSFSLGSRVLVEFGNQVWQSGRVIGYADKPLLCPPVFNTTISNQSWVVGSFQSFDVSANWSSSSYGRRWSLVSGNFPPGVTIDPLTGIISGTPGSAPNNISSVVIRCADTYFNDAINKRYADSTPFLCGVSGGQSTPGYQLALDTVVNTPIATGPLTWNGSDPYPPYTAPPAAPWQYWQGWGSPGVPLSYRKSHTMSGYVPPNGTNSTVFTGNYASIIRTSSGSRGPIVEVSPGVIRTTGGATPSPSGSWVHIAGDNTSQLYPFDDAGMAALMAWRPSFDTWAFADSTYGVTVTVTFVPTADSNGVWQFVGSSYTVSGPE